MKQQDAREHPVQNCRRHFLHQSQDDESMNFLLSYYSQLPKHQVSEAAKIKGGITNCNAEIN